MAAPMLFNALRTNLFRVETRVLSLLGFQNAGVNAHLVARILLLTLRKRHGKQNNSNLFCEHVGCRL